MAIILGPWSLLCDFSCQPGHSPPQKRASLEAFQEDKGKNLLEFNNSIRYPRNSWHANFSWSFFDSNA